MWQRVCTSKNRKIIGTIFRFTSTATSEAKNRLVRNAQWALSPRADAPVADLQLQKHLVASLQTFEGPPREH